MPQFTIGRFVFKTKKQATEKVQSILNMEGLELSENSELIRELLLCHPRSDELAEYIDTIAIRVDPEHRNSKQFYVTLSDGTSDPFSYKNCLNGKYNRRQRLIREFRKAVDDQIDEFRGGNFQCGMKCPLCSEVMNSCHIDHIEKFRDLLEQYMTSKNTDLVTIPFDVNSCKFSDNNILDDWKTYHKQHATLRCICAKCNTSLQ
jgi:hypothetical protein